jgi:hypothetical protein
VGFGVHLDIVEKKINATTHQELKLRCPTNRQHLNE